MYDKSIYVCHNPYGTSTLNRDGNRANELYWFASPDDARAFIDADPEHREYVTGAKARRLIKERSDGQGTYERPLHYLDK